MAVAEALDAAPAVAVAAGVRISVEAGAGDVQDDGAFKVEVELSVRVGHQGPHGTSGDTETPALLPIDAHLLVVFGRERIGERVGSGHHPHEVRARRFLAGSILSGIPRSVVAGRHTQKDAKDLTVGDVDFLTVLDELEAHLPRLEDTQPGAEARESIVHQGINDTGELLIGERRGLVIDDDRDKIGLTHGYFSLVKLREGSATRRRPHDTM